MIIGTCGFGSTGSSVITDYLKEFDGVTVKDDLEFTYVSAVDGLTYLERDIMNPLGRTAGSITGIMRFRDLVQKKKYVYERHGLSAEIFTRSAEQFIDAITMAKWYWYDGRVRSRSKLEYYFKLLIKKKFIPWLEKRKGDRVNIWPKVEVRLSALPNNFYEAARNHVNDLLRGMGLDPLGTIVLDQPFSGSNPQACFPFFNDPYAIVVDRDPRDNYVFAKTMLKGEYFSPIDVDNFIAYYRCLRDNRPYKQPDPRILVIRFEDMIYEYDATTKRVRDFLHLPENPHPRSVFDPNLSIANTQVFRRYPQFANDIKKIENALPEYLFDFSKYDEDPTKKRMFSGKSPLHKNFNTRYWQRNNS